MYDMEETKKNIEFKWVERKWFFLILFLALFKWGDPTQ